MAAFKSGLPADVLLPVRVRVKPCLQFLLGQCPPCRVGTPTQQLPPDVALFLIANDGKQLERAGVPLCVPTSLQTSPVLVTCGGRSSQVTPSVVGTKPNIC